MLDIRVVVAGTVVYTVEVTVEARLTSSPISWSLCSTKSKFGDERIVAVGISGEILMEVSCGFEACTVWVGPRSSSMDAVRFAIFAFATVIGSTTVVDEVIVTV
jgi:hypothetical protein